MSESAHEIEPVAEMQSVFRDHPDHELFSKLGSPQNFLTRQHGTGGEIERGNVGHYAYSQSVFANNSMKCLIDLTREFDWRRGGFAMEDLYKRIAEERLMIAVNTQDTRRNEASLKKAYKNLFGIDLGNQPDAVYTSEEEMASEVQAAENILTSLSYWPSEQRHPTLTVLGGNKKYERYFEFDTECARPLSLLNLMSLLGEEGKFIDFDTTLGCVYKNREGKVTHVMGIYREKHEEIESTTKEVRSARVNEITDLAAKKALETSDEKEALQYALVFGILRGYNIRSVIGACFAQEMSMRWVFAQKDWPQFNKAPGIYLDIEASLLNVDEAPNETLRNLVQKEVRDYETANLAVHDSAILLGDDSIFDVPCQQKQNDFAIYLMEARRYRCEDLSALISCEIPQSIFNIAARNGDTSFFKMLQEECDTKPEFKQVFDEALTKVNRDEVVACAMQYGGEVMRLAANLTRPSAVVKTQDCSPFAVDQIDGVLFP